MNKVRISEDFDEKSDAIVYPGNTLDLLPKIPDKFVQLVVTSPPYNIGKSYEKRLSINEYLISQKKVINECARILKDTGNLCWQVGNYIDNGEIVPLDIILYPIFSSLGLHLRNRIIWHFGHGLHSSRRFSGRYEVIMWFTKGNDYIFNLDKIRIPQKYPNKKYFKGPRKGELSGNPLGKNPSDVWEIPNVKANHVEKTIHPCQFPVELVERLVLSMTNEGDWVFDPFLGVGSTAIAALIHNRRVIGAEILDDYVEITKDRIHKAEIGKLRIRPMERNVYEPHNNSNIPPKLVYLGSSNNKLRLFQRKVKYQGDAG